MIGYQWLIEENEGRTGKSPDSQVSKITLCDTIMVDKLYICQNPQDV